VIETLDSSRKDTVKLLESMTDLIVPDRMWFTSLDVQGDNIAIAGIALDERTVADFMVKLQGVYANVTLKSLNQTSVGDNNLKNFSLTLTRIQPKPAATEKAKTS